MLSQELVVPVQTPELVISNKDLKTVAFKLQSSFLGKIKDLCKNGYYASLSEVARIAVFEFMAELLTLREQGGKFWNEFYNKDENIEKKVPISVKIPIAMLDNMNSIIRDFQFKDRSKFIRSALTRFINEDQDNFHNFLSK
ncbi:MAG: putative nickel-responsive regulator [Candidatus Heimdallarchaeota archaeon LC_3]|nr:MAG: putative nickel-responsive regulator [Candidatus Heimdallarchaeota archaeon LC_3]